MRSGVSSHRPGGAANGNENAASPSTTACTAAPTRGPSRGARACAHRRIRPEAPPGRTACTCSRPRASRPRAAGPACRSSAVPRTTGRPTRTGSGRTGMARRALLSLRISSRLDTNSSGASAPLSGLDAPDKDKTTNPIRQYLTFGRLGSANPPGTRRIPGPSPFRRAGAPFTMRREGRGRSRARTDVREPRRRDPDGTSPFDPRPTPPPGAALVAAGPPGRIGRRRPAPGRPGSRRASPSPART